MGRVALAPPTTKAAGNLHSQGIVGGPAEWHDTTQDSTTLPLRKLSGGEATQVDTSSYPHTCGQGTWQSRQAQRSHSSLGLWH